MEGLLLIAIVVVIGVVAVKALQGKEDKAVAQRENLQLEDEVAGARRWIERLGSQVLSISGTDTASTQAMADASERYTAASSQISTAQTPKQAKLARESALEGLYYVAAAREIMGMPAGPELPPLEGQKSAGKVTERRTIEHEGETITASPTASAETPNYYPGGRVAGRPVPAGWYSQPWWAGALATGMWAMGSALLFSSLFAGMSGVGYGAEGFENGYGEGYEDGLADAADADAADAGAAGDAGEAGDAGDIGGGDAGGDMGDAGMGDAGDGGGLFGGGFFGGDDGGGFFDGGFDF